MARKRLRGHATLWTVGGSQGTLERLTQVWGEYANSTQKDHRSQSQTHPQQGWATHFLKGQHEKLGLVWIAAVINL